MKNADKPAVVDRVRHALEQAGWSFNRYGFMVSPSGTVRVVPRDNVLRLERRVVVGNNAEWFRSRSYPYIEAAKLIIAAKKFASVF